MTFYELLHKVPFDGLIPTLKSLDAGEIYPYREAFDELMLIGAVEEDDGVIEVSCDEEDESWIHVTGCQNYWREVLASRIEVEDGLELGDCELAAHILWEMTFYGFSEDDTPSFREHPDNEYERRRSGVRSRQMAMYARGRKEKSECFKGAMLLETLERIDARMKRRNRAKRMRDARMERTMTRLERMSKVEECIKNLMSICPELDREELGYLFDTKVIHETRVRQHRGDAGYEPASLQRLIRDYSTIASADYDSIILVLYSDSRVNVPKELESDIREMFIAGRGLKRCVFKVSEYADMRSGDLVLKVVQSLDAATQVGNIKRQSLIRIISSQNN